MTMIAATATALTPRRIQKPLERNPSETSRRATRPTGRSRRSPWLPARAGSPGSSADVLGGVLVGRATDEVEEHFGERAPFESEAAHGAGSPSGVEGGLGPLDDAPSPPVMLSRTAPVVLPSTENWWGRAAPSTLRRDRPARR